MKITPTQARQVLTGTKTQHRIQAKTQRPPTRPGRTTQLAPGLTARVRVLDAQWITADWTDYTSLRAEGFKNPAELKRDWIVRYDAKWLDKTDEPTDSVIVERFAKRWASTPAWLLTIEPIATERHLLPAARPAGTTLGYTGRTIQDHPGPASRSIDPLDAGEVIDASVLSADWGTTSARRYSDARGDAEARAEARSISREVRESVLDAKRRGRDTAGPLERIRRELDAMREDRREDAA